MAVLGQEERYTAEIHDMVTRKYGIEVSEQLGKKGYGAKALLIPLHPSVSKFTPNY